MSNAFELFLFSTDPAVIREAVSAGIAGIVVDWEQAGKFTRQRGADTEINMQTVDDLRTVRAATGARILCRINPCGPTTQREIEEAIAEGADEILLPMVRTVDEVLAALRLVRDRCGVGILIETVAAVYSADRLARLPLSRVYLGLNDLMIDRGHTCIFNSVLDGTVERVRSAFTVPFGFAGLTLVNQGFPIPCRLLIAEMARLGCAFTFLRRSYRRDIRGHLPGDEVPVLLRAMAAAGRRSPEDAGRDRRELHDEIRRTMFDRPASLPLSR